MMRKLLERAGIVILFSILGGLAFYFSFSFFMDWDLLKERVKREIDRSSGYQVEIGTVELSGLSGLRIHELVLTDRQPKNPEKPEKIRIQKLDVRAGLFSLFGKKKKVNFEAAMLGGKITGDMALGKNSREVRVDIQSVKVDLIPGMDTAITLPLTGRLTASGNLIMPREGLKGADGDFTIACRYCVMGDGEAKVKAKFIAVPNNPASAAWAKEGFTLPPLELGRFSGKMEIRKGRATFKEFIAKSDHGEAELSGNITFRDPVKTSNAAMYFKFKFSEEVKKEHPNLEGIEISLQAKGKRSDSFYGIQMTGMLGSMRFIPAKTGVRDFMRTENENQPSPGGSSPGAPPTGRRGRSTPRPRGEK